MSSMKGFNAHRSIRLAALAAAVGLAALPAAGNAAAQSAGNAVLAQAQALAFQAWHEQIKQLAPPAEGCFQAVYPSTVWKSEACGAAPAFRSAAGPADAPASSGSRDRQTLGTASLDAFNVGNGTDYAAQTLGLTSSATGSFPSVSGVTSGSDDYSLQINTNLGAGPSSYCSSHGYSRCQTWEQFIYSTDSGGGQPQAFIQNWLFLTSSDFSRVGCPSGWNSYGPQAACYRNSKAVTVSYVPITQIGSVKLAGSVAANGVDTVTFTVNGVAHAVSQSDSTLAIASTWNTSEFNIFGNGSTSPVASFNRGSSVAVKLAVNDGSTRAPTCIGPADGGTTGESNNLTLGQCSATGGSAPAIQFTQSN